MAAVKNGDWDGSIREKLARSKSHGVTHSLLVQREGAQFIFAARIPLSAVLPIWQRQRRISDKLITRGTLGRKTKNHAINGASPAIWLQDDRTPAVHEVADALWNYPGVADLVKLPAVHGVAREVDDTFDDCAVDYEQLGTDGAAKVPVLRSKRDRRDRAEVLKRADGECERSGCADAHDWPGFLDVNHILGAETSDRVWNCVALCPNCHRDAHFAPDHAAINAALLQYVKAFRKG